MTENDLTVRILQEIRDEVRGSRQETAGLRQEMRARAEVVDQRFEVIETSLRDLAQQMVVLSRGIKSLIEGRGVDGDRIDELERRVDTLERKVS